MNCYVVNIALPLFGSFYLVDGLSIASLAHLAGPAGILAMHTQKSFNLLELQAGARLEALSLANTWTFVSFIGLEVIYAPV